MAKYIDQTAEKIKRLHFLIIDSVVRKTNEYDSEIEKLQAEIDYFNWGIKPNHDAKM